MKKAKLVEGLQWLVKSDLGVKVGAYRLASGLKARKSHVEVDGTFWYWGADGSLYRAKYGNPGREEGCQISSLLGIQM